MCNCIQLTELCNSNSRLFCAIAIVGSLCNRNSRGVFPVEEMGVKGGGLTTTLFETIIPKALILGGVQAFQKMLLHTRT